MDEIESIKNAIAVLEAQRHVLGDQVVDTTLAPLREKLASLQPSPAGEQRKLVTVLFADLVGFTAMSARLDPEDVREIVNTYFTRWTSCIEGAGGTVEKFIGDAVMAVFGLSRTREDDPESAVRAALEMRQALEELNAENTKSWGVKLAMRVGIHTGTVVVSFLGERKGQDFVAVGDTVNLASRLQSAASSGGILISHTTYQHVRGIFDIQMLDPVTVKGKDEPIQVYQVLQAKQRAFHVATRGVEGIETHMVGRDSELAQLKDALQTAVEGRKTQMITVVGEAGIGKSRLIAEFESWLDLLPLVVRYFKGRASPSMQSQPYSLLRDLFAFRFQIYESDLPLVVQQKFERGIGEFELADREKQPASSGSALDGPNLSFETQKRAHLIAHLLGYKLENSPHLGGAVSDPLMLRDRAMASLRDYFKAVAAVRSIVMLLEDIHWADDSSLDAVMQLVDGLPEEPLFLVCAARPTIFERRPAWGKSGSASQAACSFISLQPLSQDDSQRLVGEILQKVGDVPDIFTQQVFSRAEGNPFYLEELVKMLIEKGIIIKEDERWRIDLSHLAETQIPSTLVEVLQARFDSLNMDERVLLQRAAVLGRVFWDKALEFMEEGQEDSLQLSPRLVDILFDLTAREMVFMDSVSAFKDTQEYHFKHSLVRDVTYENVLKRLRKIYHAYAASWLETVTEQSGRSGEYAFQIAEHYDLAEDHEKARTWYMSAGIQADSHYANAEAIRCLTHCLGHWPENDPAGKFDVILRRIRLYDVVADRQAQRQDLETAEILADQLDEDDVRKGQQKVSRRARVSLQWWHYYDAVGDSNASASAAREAVKLARECEDLESEVLGNLYLGATLWRQSDYPASRETLEKALGQARAERSKKIEADVLRNLGIVLQYQGDYAGSQHCYEEALKLYQDTGDERGESMQLNSLGSLLMEHGSHPEARAYFLRSLELKRKIGHRRAEHVTLFNLGFVADRSGFYRQASTYFDTVLHFCQEAGDKDMETDSLIALAGVALHKGETSQTKSRLNQALNLAREIGSKNYECQTHIQFAFLYQQLGDYEQSYQHSQRAQVLARDFDLLDEKIVSMFCLGQALLALGRLQDASQAYQEALELAQQRHFFYPIVELQAGLARACLALQNLSLAVEIVGEILSRLEAADGSETDQQVGLHAAALEGSQDPFQVLATCYQVLSAANAPRAGALLSASQRFRAYREQIAGLPE